MAVGAGIAGTGPSGLLPPGPRYRVRGQPDAASLTRQPGGHRAPHERDRRMIGDGLAGVDLRARIIRRDACKLLKLLTAVSLLDGISSTPTELCSAGCAPVLLPLWEKVPERSEGG